MGTLISLIQYIGGYRSGRGGGSACILYLYTPVTYLAAPPPPRPDGKDQQKRKDKRT